MKMEYKILVYNNKIDIQNCNTYRDMEAAKSHYGCFGEGAGVKGEEECVYY